MADEWIKMRKDLKGDPAVLWLSTKLQTRPETVIGYLHQFWSWCDDQIADGDAVGVTLSALGDAIALPGFPELLCKVGWLKYDDCGEFPMITIPKFDVHMSESAKKRAESAKRMQRKRRRDTLRKNYAKSVTREEKRREEKRREEKSMTVPSMVASATIPGTVSCGLPATTDTDGWFDEIWEKYPSRKGRKRGKSPAKRLATSIPDGERTALATAVENYRASKEARNGFARDMDKFLTDDWWRDWIEGSENEVEDIFR